jgi:cell division protease FtsH
MPSMGLPAPLVRRFAHLAAMLRRRPRTAAALGVVLGASLVLGAIAVGGPLLRSAQPPVAAGTGPTFTYSGTWSLLDLQRHVEAGEVAAVSVDRGTDTASSLVAKTTDGQVVLVALTVDPASAVQALANLGHSALLTNEAWSAVPSAAQADRSGDPLRTLLGLLVPIALLVVLFLVLRRSIGRGGGRDSVTPFTTILPTAAAAAKGGRKVAKAQGHGLVVEAPHVRLADVAGCEDAKLELTETIEFLRSPDRFVALGAKIPRGLLLYGPPGTGKTLLAKAVAAEANVPFIAASAAEFVEKYVGVGARRVRELFAQARKNGRCVVFVDEFDALAKVRGGTNSHEEREQTLNQLLVELDGFSTTDEVVVIAATNRLDTIDPAVLRPGRFNRKIHVGLPDVSGRRDILAVHAKDKPIGEAVDLDTVARKTYGFSGAQLADLMNEAAIFAARRGGVRILDEDIHNGWLKVAVGSSRRRSMDERERSIIAAHEVGHAICGRVHGDKRKVEEISLFAHGEALGVTVSSQEDNDLPAESDLRARLVALMGGRAAEELLFQEVTGGAANDFEQANRIAFAMVTRWGMGTDPDATEPGASGRGSLSFFIARPGGSLPNDVQAAATRATRWILDQAYAQASETLVEHMELLRKLAAYLVEHERVDGETFDALVDGTIEVPNAAGEWRPNAARPRAWTDISDYHATRRRSRPVLVPPQQDDPPAPPIARRPTTPAPVPGSIPAAASLPLPAAPVPAPAAQPSPAIVAPAIRARGARADLVRRVRRLAAAQLAHAEAWLRADEGHTGA